MHGKQEDGLSTKEREELQLKLEQQYIEGSTTMLDKDKHLMEVDFTGLWARSGVDKKYWYRAMVQARAAAGRETESRTNLAHRQNLQRNSKRQRQKENQQQEPTAKRNRSSDVNVARTSD